MPLPKTNSQNKACSLKRTACSLFPKPVAIVSSFTNKNPPKRLKAIWGDLVLMMYYTTQVIYRYLYRYYQYKYWYYQFKLNYCFTKLVVITSLPLFSFTKYTPLG